MEYRFTLSHDAFPDKVISEPEGFDKAQLKLLRHEDFHSLIEYYEGEFVFYGSDQFDDGGIDYIREVESTYGHDTDLRITIEVAPDGVTYQTLFIGLLKLAELEELPDNKIQVPVIRDDFWSKFINRQETQVDIQSERDLDGNNVNIFDAINIRMSSQRIQQINDGLFSRGIIISEEWTENTELDFRNVQISMDVLVQDEIEEAFFIPAALNSEVPVSIFTLLYGGEYRLTCQIFYGVIYDDGLAMLPDRMNTDDMVWCYRINDGDLIQFDVHVQNWPVSEGGASSDTGPFVSDGLCTYATLDVILNLNAGDEIRVYAISPGEYGSGGVAITIGFIIYGQDNSNLSISDLEFYGPGQTVNVGYPDPVNGFNYSFLKLVGQTEFTPTNSEGFLIHDTGGQICDRIIGQDDSFYSEVLGSDQTVYRQYDFEGCFWNHAESKGLQIRRYTLLEKPFFQSFKQWWEGVNPIFNLGLGYELFNGQQVIRVEDKRHFYDDSEVSINISNVRDIVRKYDENRLFKAVRIGYKKWQSEDISGIDDPQTKKTYATRLQKSGKDITIESEFIAASLAIETTRRKTKEKSADYKFDNETFIIAIRPNPIDVSPETSPDVTDYEPELDENFTSIDNLRNPESRYNSSLTPARNFLRWRDWLSAGLQPYPTDPFKFTSGEGNYDMTSIYNVVGCGSYLESLSEKQDIEISDDPFHLAMMYEIRTPLSWEEYVLIRDNRKKAIGISQTEENHVKFFIQELAYTPDDGEAVIMAWPVEILNIETIETLSTSQICSDSCYDGYLTEDGFEYETEDGNCLVLN